MARPLKEIDEEQVKKLASFGLSYGEIAALLECSHDTIERRFASAIKEGHERRNASLRRRQYLGAMKGSVPLLIWLGKQYLGQTDKVQQEHGGGITIQVVYEDIDPNCDAADEEPKPYEPQGRPSPLL